METIGDSIDVINASKKVDGFWIYTPNKNFRSAENVVLFMHGYGAYNPMIFGAWIRHLVEDGNIVIYPRYQKTLYVPSPKKFVDKALTGLKDALLVLEATGWDSALWKELDLVGHSYGGVISMNFAQNQLEYDLPLIKNVMICSAGTGPFKAGILDSYDQVDANLIMVTSHFDTTVGNKFTKRVERLTPSKKNKIYLHQKSASVGGIKLTSHHNEPYALDEEFDNDVRNYTAKKALRVGRTNILDTAGYWKLFDDLMAHEADFVLFKNGQKAWPLSEKHPELKLNVKDVK